MQNTKIPAGISKTDRTTGQQYITNRTQTKVERGTAAKEELSSQNSGSEDKK